MDELFLFPLYDVIAPIEECVLYESMGSKGHKALSSIPFLQQYAGILVHDHETSLYSYGLDHAECNVHLLRYL